MDFWKKTERLHGVRRCLNVFFDIYPVEYVGRERASNGSSVQSSQLHAVVKTGRGRNQGLRCSENAKGLDADEESAAAAMEGKEKGRASKQSKQQGGKLKSTNACGGRPAGVNLSLRLAWRADLI